MSDREDLLAEIRTVLPPGGAVQIGQSELSDLFEAYVLSGLNPSRSSRGLDSIIA